jgi:hypothetical protein
MGMIRYNIVLHQIRHQHYKHRLERFRRPLYRNCEINTFLISVAVFSVLVHQFINS